MDFIDQFKAARRVSTPLICVRTFDPKSTTKAIVQSLRVNNKLDSTPLLFWDAIHGLLPLNTSNPSKQAHADTLAAKGEDQAKHSTTAEGRSCTRKIRHTPETAAIYWGIAPRYLSIYICGYCGFLHFTHMNK